MKPVEPNKQRRRTLAKALKECGAEDRLSLEELAMLWGTAKSRFTNVKNEMIRLGYDFPPPEAGKGNQHIYHAKRALQCMLDYETRNDQSAHAKDQAIKKILGQEEEQDRDGVLSISELAMLNREAARAEERAIEQGKHVPVADTAATAARVFSIITNFFGDLPARLDPNGQLPKHVRDLLRTQGQAAVVSIHTEIKQELSNDPRPRNQKRARSSGRAD